MNLNHIQFVCYIVFSLFDCALSLKTSKLENAVNVVAAEKVLGNPVKVKITKSAGEDLHLHWSSQAVSALIAAVANEKLATVPDRVAKQHEKCSKNAHNVKDHAQCVQQLLDIEKRYASATFIKMKKKANLVRKLKRKTGRIGSREQEWIGSFRLRSKREIIRKSSYELNSQAQKSPFGMIAQQITNSIRTLKNKKETRSWKEIMKNVKREGKKLETSNKVQKMLKASLSGTNRVISRRPKYLKVKDVDVLTRRLKQNRRPLADEVQPDSLENSTESDEDSIKLSEPGEFAKHVLEETCEGKRKMNAKEKGMMEQVNLIRDGVKIGLRLFGQNSTDMDRKNIKLISPRLLSIVPEDTNASNDTVDVLSPSLFSLHSEGQGIEKATSLSNLLGVFDKNDKDLFMDLITEATGITEALEDAEKKVMEKITAEDGMLVNSEGKEVRLSSENITEIYGTEGYRTLKAFEKLNSMYNDEQMRQFKEYGYAQMTDKQLHMVYGKNGIYENPAILSNSLNRSLPDTRKHIYQTIKQLSTGEAQIMRKNQRMKDYILSPFLFAAIVGAPEAASQNIILSPVLLSALVRSPAIFSSVILSPWVFVPVIVSPRALSPVILSPFLFAPIILSPLVMLPVILSPGVGNPLVLSPFVMVPFVLSPQVMTPIILSPYALSPGVLSPFMLSPLVLSPFVLSPSVYSPPSFTAVILSPYALSPSIESTPKNITVFASPSFLS